VPRLLEQEKLLLLLLQQEKLTRLLPLPLLLLLPLRLLLRPPSPSRRSHPSWMPWKVRTPRPLPPWIPSL